MASGAPPSASAPPPAFSSSSSSGLPPPPPPPKILLAKHLSASGAAPRFGSADDPSAAVHRSRYASHPGSLHLISETWELHTERILPFLTDNNDFTVVGIIGPPGVGKSTIMNELYGYDGNSPGMFPPFPVQTDETKSIAKHGTVGVELRVSSERLVLLDAQPIFSSSILIDMMRPDGSSSIPVLNEQPLSADLAHEMMGIQLGVFLASVCNVLLVVSEGVDDFNLWQLMLTVDLLKHDLPDPSILASTNSLVASSGPDKESRANDQVAGQVFSAALVFVHSKLRNEEASPINTTLLKKALLHFFSSSCFKASETHRTKQNEASGSLNMESLEENTQQDLFLLPVKMPENLQKPRFDSYSSILGKLRDQVISMNGRSFARNISERDWLKSSAKIWELVKKSPVISDYSRSLQASGLFRK